MAEDQQKQLLKSIATFLRNQKISYMITGAWSVIYYGRPRASHDIDFVVEMDVKKIKNILQAFQKLSDEYLIQLDEIQKAISNRSVFNILHLPTGLKLDFWILQGDEFDATRFARRKRVKLLGQYMYIATAEDTILKKLLWYKESKIEKHLVDAAFIYQIQKSLDKAYLQHWTKKQQTTKFLKDIGKIDLEKYY